jgi:hypothetical protein
MSDEKMTPEEFEYKFRKFVSAQSFNSEFLKDCEEPVVRFIVDGLMGGLDETTILLRWDLACRDLMEKKWPKDWRQSFKERWFPKWLLKRYPVIYERVTLKEIAGIKRPPGKSNIKVRYALELNETGRGIGVNNV